MWLQKTSLLSLLLALTVDSAERRQITPEVQLREELFTKRQYDPLKVPLTVYNNGTALIHLGITFLGIAEVDPQQNSFAATLLLDFDWRDYALTWKSEDYNGLEYITVDPMLIWTPNITLLNSFEDNPEKYVAFTNVVLKDNGDCRLVLSSLSRSFCTMDVKDFPFDEHTCSFIFGSWTQDGSQVLLYDGAVIADGEFFTQASEWEYKSASFRKVTYKLKCCPLWPFYGIEFRVTFSRHSAYYKASVLMPSIMSALLILVLFWLPPTAKEKFMLGGFILLTLLLQLIHVTMIIPFNGGNLPNIVRFLGVATVLGGLSLVLSALTSCLPRSCSSSSRPAPAILKNIVSSLGSKFCCLQKETASLKFYDDNSNSNQKLDQDWLMAAILLDRIFFLIYCIAFIITIPVIFH